MHKWRDGAHSLQLENKDDFNSSLFIGLLGNETLAGGECLDKIEKSWKYFVQRRVAEKPDKGKNSAEIRAITQHNLAKVVQPPID